MNTIKNDKVYYYDCDETLVMWNSPADARHASLKFDNYGYIENLVPNYRMIDSLKRNFDKGHFIIVWSQNGFKWAEEVVSKLNIEEYVHQKQCKPSLIFDDLPPEDFIKRAYLNPDYEDSRYKEKNNKEEG